MLDLLCVRKVQNVYIFKSSPSDYSVELDPGMFDLGNGGKSPLAWGGRRQGYKFDFL